MPTDQHYMQLALDACRVGVDKGQSPFGACIVSAGGEVLACTHNHVRLLTDPSAHAEVMAIRDACGKLKDVHLTGATIFSTTEPCPMCFTAIHWARIARIVSAATIADAASFGFNELPVSNAHLRKVGGAGVELTAEYMREQAVELYRYWRDRHGQPY